MKIMAIDTLTTRLYEQSDAKLKAEIDNAADHLTAFFRNGCVNQIQIGSEMVNFYTIMERVREKAIELHQARRRQQAIDDFLSKVESLSTEIEELKNSIPQ